MRVSNSGMPVISWYPGEFDDSDDGFNGDDSERPWDVEINWNDIPAPARGKVEAIVTLVLTVLTSLVDREEDVRLVVHANHRRVIITARVNQSDVGFALGSHGLHATALRTLLIAACKKLDFHVEIDIGGPSGVTDWSSS